MNILIVEDEALIAMDIAAIVEDSGHRVVAEAVSDIEVTALPDTPRVELAFVDLHLANGSSGIDACRTVRIRWPECVIVFVTANPAKLPADLAGAHGLITKPFSASAFRSTIAYLEQGIRQPPPLLPVPKDFMPADVLKHSFGAGSPA